MRIRELSDNKNNISSTRWAFCLIVKFAMYSIIGVLLSYVICHIIGKPLDEEFLSNASKLISIPVGIIAICKGAQGFEQHKKPTDVETTDEVENGK